MDVVILARLQFAVTTVYHFFFVPLTLGLVVLVAILETMYVRTGDETYKKMTKFWGKLFLINFAMGVVTGIVQEFQFGMNWSEYSRFMGDIFGAPLAIEALLAFYLESIFIGVWIFGWDKISKPLHAVVIWIVAIGSNISALWILVANSFMQQPVGYVLRNGRAEMDDFFALLANGHVWVQWPHVFFSAVATAGFFVAGISAWHLLRKSDQIEVFTRSFRIGVLFATIGVLFSMLVGHSQAQYMTRIQPMKMAAAEALWETEDPAAMSLFTIGNEKERRDVFAIRVPGLLSFMAYNRFSGEVQGHQRSPATSTDAPMAPATTCRRWPSPTGPSASWSAPGSAMLLLAAFGLWKAAKKGVPDERPLPQAHVLGHRPALHRQLAPAGSSPRSAGSRGSSSGCRRPPTRSRHRWASVRCCSRSSPSPWSTACSWWRTWCCSRSTPPPGCPTMTQRSRRRRRGVGKGGRHGSQHSLVCAHRRALRRFLLPRGFRLRRRHPPSLPR